jgi:hypothetical protein
MNSSGKLRPTGARVETRRRDQADRALDKTKRPKNAAIRESRHDGLRQHSRLSRPNRAPLFDVRDNGDGGMQVTAAGQLEAGEFRLLVERLAGETVQIHGEGNSVIVSGDLKLARKCLAEIDDAFTLLKGLGLKPSDACSALAKSNALWHAFSGEPISFSPGNAHAPLKLDGRQDISRLQQIFHALIELGHAPFAAGLLHAAPSGVLLKCLFRGDRPLADFEPAQELAQEWPGIIRRAASAAIRKKDHESLGRCFDKVPGRAKAAFAESVLPHDSRDRCKLLEGLISSAVQQALAGTTTPQALLELATELMVAALGRKDMSNDEFAALGAVISAALHDLQQAPPSETGVTERTCLLLIGLAQTIDAETDLDQIAQMRSLASQVQQGPEDPVHAQLHHVEQAYIEASVNHLRAQFEYKLDPPSKNGEPFTLHIAPSGDAFEALATLIEFELASLQPGTVMHGRELLKALIAKAEKSEEYPQLEPRLTSLLNASLLQASTALANHGHHTAALQLLRDSPAAPEAFTMFLNSGNTSPEVRETWAEFATDYLTRVFSTLQPGDSGQVPKLISSNPDVRRALEVLGHCDEKKLDALFKNYVDPSRRAPLAQALLALTPQGVKSSLVRVALNATPFVLSVWPIVGWTQDVYSAYAKVVMGAGGEGKIAAILSDAQVTGGSKSQGDLEEMRTAFRAALKDATATKEFREALATGANSALIVLEKLPPRLLSSIIDFHAWSNLGATFCNDVQEVLKTEDFGTVDELCRRLASVGSSFPNNFVQIVLDDANQQIQQQPISVRCRFIAAVIKSDIRVGSMTSDTYAMLLADALKGTNRENIAAGLANLIGAFPDGPARQRLVDALAATLKRSLSTYLNGIRNPAPVIAELVSVLRGLRGELSAEQVRTLKAGKTLTQGIWFAGRQFRKDAKK